MKITLLTIVFFVLFIFGFWLIAIPDSLILNHIENIIAEEGFYLKIEGFRKGLLFSCSVRKVNLYKKSGHLTTQQPPAGIIDSNILTLEDVNIRLNLLSLLKFSPALNLDFIVNGGKVAGEAALSGRQARINGNNIKISGIPLFEQAGINGEGDMSVTLAISSKKGDIQFSADNVRLKNTSFGAVFLPLEMFHNIRGAMTLNGSAIEIRSFTLDGNSVYARVKGDIKGNNLNMIMELMIDSSFKSGSFPLWMLESYKVSPGYYVIPLKTTLKY